MASSPTAPDARPRALVWTGVSLAAGVAFALCMPPVDLVPVLWLSLAVFAYVLGATPASAAGRVRRVFDGAAPGLAFGLGANAASLRFLPWVVARFTSMSWVVGLVVLLLVGLVQGTVWAVIGMVRSLLVRWRMPPWLAFGVGGFAGAFVPTIFPWTPAGLLTRWPAVVQLADLAGERGVSFLAFLTAGLLAEAVRAGSKEGWRARPVMRLALAAVALPCVQAVYGAARIAGVESWRAGFPTVRVGLVSPGFEATERWNETQSGALLDRLEALTRESEGKGAQLTVWSEAAYPFPLLHGTLQAPSGTYAILQPGVHGPVLFGALTATEGVATYNSALVASADGTVTDSYDKVHLLWFGETVPLGDVLPFLKKMFIRGTGLVAGAHSDALPAGPVRAGILICYEDTLTAAGREAAASNPNLLVNLTNDAWFAGSWESDNQMRLATMRAVETRRDLIRSVNEGVSGWVDAAGIVRARSSGSQAGVTMAEPALVESGLTFYGRIGDLPLVVLLGGLAWRSRRASRAAGASGASGGGGGGAAAREKAQPPG